VAKPKLINAKIYGSTPDPVKERRAQLWNALNRFIIESGAGVTSVPGVSPLRIEISKTSNLPTQLMDAGYTVHQCGRVTRIGGPKTFMEADVIEVDLPRIY
jgi:hypothetical protein